MCHSTVKGRAFSNKSAQKGRLLKYCLVCERGPCSHLWPERKETSHHHLHAPRPGSLGLSFLTREIARNQQTELEGIQRLSSAPRRHATQMKVETVLEKEIVSPLPADGRPLWPRGEGAGPLPGLPTAASPWLPFQHLRKQRPG